MRPMYKRILLAYDGSEPGQKALLDASEIAEWGGADVFLVAQPLFNAFSRHLEHEADRFGLEITRDNRAAGEAFIALQQQNLGVPRPNIVMHILRDTHPSVAERIAFANTYKPWATGEPLVYADKFRQ